MSNINQEKISPIAFNLGTIGVTRRLNDLCNNDHSLLLPLLEKHRSCDWGRCSPESVEMNNEATHNKEKIMSIYVFSGVVIWIITDYGHKQTTILLPSDY